MAKEDPKKIDFEPVTIFVPDVDIDPFNAGSFAVGNLPGITFPIGMDDIDPASIDSRTLDEKISDEVKAQVSEMRKEILEGDRYLFVCHDGYMEVLYGGKTYRCNNAPIKLQAFIQGLYINKYKKSGSLLEALNYNRNTFNDHRKKFNREMFDITGIQKVLFGKRGQNYEMAIPYSMNTEKLDDLVQSLIRKNEW